MENNNTQIKDTIDLVPVETVAMEIGVHAKDIVNVSVDLCVDTYRKNRKWWIPRADVETFKEFFKKKTNKRSVRDDQAFAALFLARLAMKRIDQLFLSLGVSSHEVEKLPTEFDEMKSMVRAAEHVTRLGGHLSLDEKMKWSHLLNQMDLSYGKLLKRKFAENKKDKQVIVVFYNLAQHILQTSLTSELGMYISIFKRAFMNMQFIMHRMSHGDHDFYKLETLMMHKIRKRLLYP